MGAFDPSTFLDTPVSGVSSTKLEPIPDGEYPGIFKLADPPIVEWTKKDGSMSGLKLVGKVVLDDPALKEKLGRQEVSVKYDIMLDLTDDGKLDMGKGKNVALGRLREATGLNQPGEAFSWRMLDGRPVKAKVTQRLVGEDIFNDVKAVTKLF